MMEKIDEVADESLNEDAEPVAVIQAAALLKLQLYEIPQRLGVTILCICGNGRKFKKCCGKNI